MSLPGPAQQLESRCTRCRHATRSGTDPGPWLQTLWSRPPGRVGHKGRVCPCPHPSSAWLHLSFSLSCCMSWNQAPNHSSGSVVMICTTWSSRISHYFVFLGPEGRTECRQGLGGACCRGLVGGEERGSAPSWVFGHMGTLLLSNSILVQPVLRHGCKQPGLQKLSLMPAPFPPHQFSGFPTSLLPNSPNKCEM